MNYPVEKYWYAVGFWHAKTKEYIEPSVEEIDYLKSLTGIDILKEYKKGYKAAKGEKNNDE